MQQHRKEELAMQYKTILVVMIASIAALLISVQPAMARGCQVGSGDYAFEIDKTAPGTKLSGPLVIYYEGTGGLVDLTFFMRLKKGYNIFPFSGTADGVVYDSIPEIQEAVDAFVSETVIPALFACTAGSDCPPHALKSVDMLVEPDTEGFPDGQTCCGQMRFTILDLVIAVDE
jgi:hypothetical protein